MSRALETSGLPNAVARALWPWIEAIEAATPGPPERGAALGKIAVRAARDVRRLIVVTAPLETMLDDALCGSIDLACVVACPGSDVAKARTDALLILGDLIAWLQLAKASEWARATDAAW